MGSGPKWNLKLKCLSKGVFLHSTLVRGGCGFISYGFIHDDAIWQAQVTNKGSHSAKLAIEMEHGREWTVKFRHFLASDMDMVAFERVYIRWSKMKKRLDVFTSLTQNCRWRLWGTLKGHNIYTSRLCGGRENPSVCKWWIYWWFRGLCTYICIVSLLLCSPFKLTPKFLVWQPRSTGFGRGAVWRISSEFTGGCG